jgi:hypothetical protein
LEGVGGCRLAVGGGQGGQQEVLGRQGGSLEVEVLEGTVRLIDYIGRVGLRDHCYAHQSNFKGGSDFRPELQMVPDGSVGWVVHSEEVVVGERGLGESALQHMTELVAEGVLQRVGG